MSKGFGLIRPGQKIEGVGENRLRYLIESGEFSPYNFVFDYEALDWIRPCDDPILLPVEILSQWIESPFERPNFNPPPFPPEINDSIPHNVQTTGEVYVPSGEVDVEKLKMEISLLEQENSDQMDRLIEKENKIVDLTNQLASLERKIKFIHNGDFEDKINELEEENKKLRVQNRILSKESNLLKHKLIEKSKALLSLKVKAKNLLKTKQQLGETFAQAINTSVLIQKELKTLQADLTKLKKEKSEDQKNQKQAEEKFIKPKSKPEQEIVEEIPLNSHLEIEPVVQKRPPKIAPNFDRIQETLNTKSKAELETLMGEYFAIDNSPIWMVKYDGAEKGPFRYEDVRSMIKFEKIDPQSKIKKKGETQFLPLKEHLEFSAPVEEVDVEDQGEISRHFLIKRSEYRAPFYEVAEIRVGSVAIKGFCVSISVSGCFIELPRINEMLLQVGGEVDVLVNAISLGHEIKSKAVIRRLSSKRPKGVGLSFEFLDAQSREIIEDFINQLLVKQDKKAA
ncbi:MAG: hypothetical protein Fur0010_11920 [Bdellovibrio sp.]